MKNKRILIFILPLLILTGIFTIESKAETISIAITAKVAYISDYGNHLEGVVNVGDIITGTYTYDTTTLDSNSSPTVGDYWHREPPFGIILNLNGYIFRTDPTNVEFLVEVVNNHGARPQDNYLLRSYKNIFDISPICEYEKPENHISWQLDDPTGEALDSIELPTEPPSLEDWESIFGLTIDYQCWDYYYDNEFFIRAHVTSAELIPTGPISQIEDIIKTIEDKLVSGEINDGQAEALITTLDTAGWLLDDGNIVAASNLVDAFIKQVEAMMRSGRLSEEDGQELINAAASAKDAFEETG